MERTTSLRRSVLHVPASDEACIEQARRSQADTIVFDLEDSVSPDEKFAARQRVAELLRHGDFGDSELAVRLNGCDTLHFKPDLHAVVAAGVRTIVLPMCERVDDLTRAAMMIDGAELRAGIGGHEAVRILALVETALGVAEARAIAAASARIDAICFGHNDFSLDMGLPAADPASGVVLHARCEISIAARAARCSAIDNLSRVVDDPDLFRADAELGASLGFHGKLCANPMQVEIANQVFTPTAEQIAYARRVVAHWEQARRAGATMVRLDNKAIDEPLVESQGRVLERARHAHVLADEPQRAPSVLRASRVLR